MRLGNVLTEYIARIRISSEKSDQKLFLNPCIDLRVSYKFCDLNYM